MSDGENVAVTTNPREVQALLEDASVAKYGVDLKKMANTLAGEGIELNGKWYDIELMHYVLNPERSHELSALAQTYLGVSLEESSAPATTGSLFDAIPEEEDSPHLKEAAVLIPLGEKLKENLPDFYDTMEEPLAKVLAQMERDGVKVDLARLKEFAEGLRKELAEREARIRYEEQKKREAEIERQRQEEERRRRIAEQEEREREHEKENRKQQNFTVTVKGGSVKLARVKKKTVTAAEIKVKKSYGRLTFSKVSGSKKLTVNSKGKITLKRGARKGKYKIKVRITAAGNTKYKAAVKNVTAVIRVK